MNVWTKIATLGPIGFLPASGTSATLFALPLLWLISWLCTNVSWLFVGSTLLLLLFVFYVLKRVDPVLIAYDKSEVVIDEIAGLWIVFLWIPLTPLRLLIGVFLFRFFDITKVCGVDYFQKLPGVVGVLLDDLYAGFLSNCILWGLIMYGLC